MFAHFSVHHCLSDSHAALIPEQLLIDILNAHGFVDPDPATTRFIARAMEVKLSDECEAACANAMARAPQRQGTKIAHVTNIRHCFVAINLYDAYIWPDVIVNEQDVGECVVCVISNLPYIADVLMSSV